MPGPLEGIRVLDLSWILSGPFCTLVLADLGAQVIKIERPEIGDLARGTAPFVGENGDSAYFMSLNRNKKSVTLDLSVKEGRDAFLGLVKKADVVVENMRPGSMKGLGLDYTELQRHNPRLIYCAISGFGQTGPYARRPALDIIVQGMGGIMSITGDPGGRPVRVGTSIGDIAAGLFAAVGVCAALRERERSGQGQMIDIGMLDCQVAILENALARYWATGEVPRPLGTRHPLATPFQAFETLDGYVVVAIIGSEEMWPLFCSAIDRVELIDDPRFQTGWSRTQHIETLEPVIAAEMKKRTTQEWVDELGRLGIPCGPVNTIDRVASDPHLAQREMFVELPHKRLGSFKYTGTPIKLSRSPADVLHPPPDLGEHTEEILAHILGISAEQIESLRAKKAI
ncbi:MAG: CoA transferase [Chloroflexi bacterium]|nr:CoA transferase [Chloroflexota bacterium]